MRASDIINQMENRVFDEYKSELVEFQDWIKTQPKIPQNMSKYLWRDFNAMLKSFKFISENLAASISEDLRFRSAKGERLANVEFEAEKRTSVHLHRSWYWKQENSSGYENDVSIYDLSDTQ